MKVLNIIFMGLEWDRVVQPIKDYHPQKVIIFQQSPDSCLEGYDNIVKAAKELADQLVNNIGFLVETEMVYVDFHDYKSCLLKIQEVVKAYHESFDEIIINASSGSKLINIAAMIVAQFFPCKIVYAIPKQYNLDRDDTLTRSRGIIGVREIKPFNLSPLIDFKPLEKKVINQLSETDLSLTDLTLGLYGSLSDYDLLKKKNLLLYHLNKMKAKNLIEVSSVGRESMIKLSDLGYFVKELIN